MSNLSIQNSRPWSNVEPRLVRFALFSLLCLLWACSPSEPEKNRPSTASSPDLLAEQAIGDLIAAITPPEETATSAVKDDWLRRRRSTMARLKNQSDARMGALLVEAFLTRNDLIVPVRSGLIEAAAHANAVAAAPVLTEIIQNYGEDMGLRTDSCRILGNTSPEVAIEVLGEILFDKERSSTAPDDEALLDGWLEAHWHMKRNPGRDLADLATDITRDASTRHLAIRNLAKYPSKISISALEEVLHESSGNSYMRRIAAQSMTEVADRDVYCPIFAQVFSREADTNFQLFLENMMSAYCE